MRRRRRILRLLVLLPLVLVALWAGAIALDSPTRLAVASDGDSGAVTASTAWPAADVPPVQRLTARDGAPLAYRTYPGDPDRVAVLVHGATGTSLDMHKVAEALQAAGATVYAISLRGHGGSGTTVGDVSYIGQLDDDLADFIKAKGLDRPGLKRTLIGFSAGGGFALRTACGPLRHAFDNYILVSPFIADHTDILRRHVGGWARIATLRIAGLSALEKLGLDWFQSLPAVAYAVDPRPDDKHTPAYTYRLLRSLHVNSDWREALAHIEAPMAILTSDADQLSNIGRDLKERNPQLQLEQMHGIPHERMVVDPAATAEIVTMWRKLNSFNVPRP